MSFSDVNGRLNEKEKWFRVDLADNHQLTDHTIVRGNRYSAQWSKE